ncbi:MAG: aminotransferase class I/II-fold pyridoxal phosphate-dependent enzyme [bacterium]
MGFDTPEKNELDPRILQKADIIVADSISQCLLRGEIHRALQAGVLKKEAGQYRWVLDLDSLKRAVTPKTNVILLTNPNNPTGAVLTADEMDAVVDVARTRNIIRRNLPPIEEWFLHQLWTVTFQSSLRRCIQNTKHHIGR